MALDKPTRPGTLTRFLFPPSLMDRVKYGRWAYISNMSLLLGLEPFQKFAVVGGGGGGWVVKKHFRVPLWSKPWTWDLKLGPS